MLGTRGAGGDGMVGTPGRPSPRSCVFISHSRCYGVTVYPLAWACGEGAACFPAGPLLGGKDCDTFTLVDSLV